MSLLDINNTIEDTSVEDKADFEKWVEDSGCIWADENDGVRIVGHSFLTIARYKDRQDFFMRIPDRIYKPIKSLFNYDVDYCLPRHNKITLNKELNIEKMMNFHIVLPYYETAVVRNKRFASMDFENEFDFNKLHVKQGDNISLDFPYPLIDNPTLLIKNCNNLHKFLPRIDELNDLYIKCYPDIICTPTNKFLNDIIYNLQNIKCKTLCVYMHAAIDHFENGSDLRSYRDCFLKNNIELIRIICDNRIFLIPNPFVTI